MVDRKLTELIPDFPVIFELVKQNGWLSKKIDPFLELWQTSSTSAQKDLILHLINHFTYLTSSDLEDCGLKIANCIENIWELKPENTQLIAVCDNSRPDGSLTVLQSLKNKFTENWKENNFVNSLPVGVNNLSNHYNLILVDDFIGSGKTIINKIEYCRKVLTSKKYEAKIYVVSLAAMEFSKTEISCKVVDFYSGYMLKKGIQELISSENIDEANRSMNELESTLAINIGKRYLNSHTFGFARSEAIYNLEANNIPNNVFPIFWWSKYRNGQQRNSMFKRL